MSDSEKFMVGLVLDTGAVAVLVRFQDEKSPCFDPSGNHDPMYFTEEQAARICMYLCQFSGFEGDLIIVEE